MKHRGNYGAIIDVHSGSVGIAIVDTNPHKKTPEILFSHREYIKISEKPTTEGLIRALRNALFASSLEFSQTGLSLLKEHDPDASISSILLICGAPWAQTATRFIHLEDKESFQVTEEKMKSLIAETERRDEEELKTSTLLKELDLTLVERSVIHTSINGYPTSNPYGKKATELTLAHISGLIPKAIVDAVQEIEDKILVRIDRTTHTFALTLFCVLRDLYPHTKQAILIDISGEATEVCVMQNEILLETYVFPYGTHTFLRDVAVALKTFPEEALTHVKEYSDKTPASIRSAIVTVSEIYSKHLEDAYTTLKERYILPSHIFVVTSKKLDIFFEKIVHVASASLLGAHGTLVSVNAQMQGDIPEQVPDIFFAIESHFFHKLHACGELD